MFLDTEFSFFFWGGGGKEKVLRIIKMKNFDNKT